MIVSENSHEHFEKAVDLVKCCVKYCVSTAVRMGNSSSININNWEKMTSVRCDGRTRLV